jgi:hypothetical protein
MKTIVNMLRRRRGRPVPIWRPRRGARGADLRLALAALPEAAFEVAPALDDPPAPRRGEPPPWEG